MRHIIIFCLLMLCQLPIWGQARLGDDGIYNPENPGDPQLPVLMHQVTLEASPKNGGSFNMTTERVAEGSSVSLYAYSETGFVFKGWMLGETLLSTERYYTYTMKDQDVKIIGLFEYNPDNVDDPQTPVLMHRLRLEASPKQGGSFNFSSQNVKEGGEIDLYAYPNDGFVFKGWMKRDSLLSEDSYYIYTMGEKDTDITGLFEYNPRNPSNPGKNSWNSATGEIIVDDFEAGGLYSAVNEAIGGYGNASQVTMMVVSGKMSTSDLGITNNYSNCTLLDLSRTYGYTEIPSYGFDGTHLQSVILPSCIERIGYNAFYDCQNLSSISCYAVVPPEASSDAFKGIAEGAVLHVLSSSVSLYAEAEGWKDFTILPLSEEVRSLEVSLPADGADGRYKNMTLELLNIQTGTRNRFIISDRLTYTFNGLLKNSDFKVSVLNTSGDVLGQLDKVSILEENVSVAFESLLQPQTVSLCLKTPSGEDVTQQAHIVWMDSAEKYLQQGNSVSGLLPDKNVLCRISLSQDLGMQYQLPEDISYLVKSADNQLEVTLLPLEKVVLKGQVVDVQSGEALSQAIVSISQKLNGLYSKSFTTKTDVKGNFSLEIYQAQTTISVSASDYISSILERQNFEDIADLGKITLKGISGTTIKTNYTYTNSVAEGETAVIGNWYADYANISYAIFNETSGKEITQFSVQYPNIVLLEEVAEGDRLRLTASHRNGDFQPVVVKTTVGKDNRAEVTVPILELGGIRASFVSSDNASVVGILYDNNGQLIQKYNYGQATLSVSGLEDGVYTLVSMAQSNLFNSILNLSQFSASGLIEGKDYVLNVLNVKSGAITTVSNELIPKLDESKLYYTGSNTSFTVNKSQIMAGNYLTLKSKIDFKSAFSSQVEDVSLVVDLPESCSFVENSVMVGSSISSYVLNGSRLTVPLSDYNDAVRFCVIPQLGGNYAPSAFVHFRLADKEVLQPIGSAGYEVKNLTINVPSVASKKSISVNGVAVGQSQVQIFDNGVLIGETASLANGVWNTSCELNEAYNLSRHEIYAKVTTKDGLEMQSETKNCIYDMSAVQVSKVTMYYSSYKVEFDFLKPTTAAQQYTFVPSQDLFTFTIDFTDNDTTKVDHVVLYVKTGDGRQVPLRATFDKAKSLWVASGRFGTQASNDIPVNVSVDFDAMINSAVDADHALDEAMEIEELANTYAKDLATLNSLFGDTQEITDEQLLEYGNILGIKFVTTDEGADVLLPDGFEQWSEADKISYFEQKYNELEKRVTLLCDSSELISQYLTLKKDLTQIFENDLSMSVASKCNETEESLLKKGFKQYDATNHSHVYLLTTEDSLVYVNLDQQISVTIRNYLDNSSVARMARAASDDPWHQKLADTYAKIKEAIDKVNEYFDDITELAGKPIEDLDKEISRLEQEIKIVRRFKNDYKKYLSNPTQIHWNIQEFRLQKALGSVQLAKRVVKPLLGKLLKCIPVLDYLATLQDCYTRAEKINELYNSIPDPCEEDQATANACKFSCGSLLTAVGAFAIAEVLGNFTADTEIVGGALASVATAGTSLSVTAWGLVQKVLVKVGSFALDFAKDFAFKQLEKDINGLACQKEDPEEPEDPQNPNIPDDPKGSEGGEHHSGTPDADPIIDPAGYVYEAVSSNRLEGVTATCYYKEVVEDMYGDLHENVVLWNAAEYAQENPLFTDENGMYRWDVPQGMWQVKFEKEGYETTYSEWLPVPPPQLEVNIPMQQNRQPEVAVAHAYEDGIEIQFDKYMQPESMTGENIFVTKNGQDVGGTITLLDAEQAYTDNPATYVSKVRFVPATPFLTTDEIVLTVSRKVKSYAGISMETDFTQSFDVEREVKELVVDSVVSVPYTGTKTIRVSATPFDAAIGKVLTVKSSSPMIVSVDENSFKLDENGQASVVVHGNLPGSAVLSFLIEDIAVSASTAVKVSTDVPMQTATPVASRVSGTAVYRNTAIELSCETENAVIYYTVDGSCPCDENGTRQVYKEPIVVSKDMTIKAMAHVEKYEDSEVAEFTYTIKTATLGLNLHTGWNWISHNLETEVPVAQLQEDAVRIVGQESEVIKDPQLGFEGNLQSLSPLETYKVQAVDDGQNILTGFAFNPATALTLEQGWNWLGYPMNQVMSLDEAFALAELEEEDLLVGQDGFAQYAEGAWTGTLKTLAPGKGYLFCSKSDKKFSYNANIVSKAQSLYAQGIKNESSWTVDKYKYPNIMCLIADLYDQGASVVADAYAVGAFAGTECRGIAQVVDGKLMMNIYGEGGEEITFKAMKYSSEELFSIQETVPFEVTLLGSVKTPYKLNISKTTDISNQEKHWKVYPTLVSSRLYISYDGQEVDKVTLTDAYGTVAVLNRNLKDNESIDISHLPDGVYIVTAVAGNEVYYKKIVKVSR